MQITGTRGKFSYRLFGFRVLSDINLPELGPPGSDQDSTNMDVSIELGAVATSLDDGVRVHGYFEFNKTECLVDIEGIARLEISGGKRIVVEPVQGAAENDIRAYLFGTGMAVLLHQRKCLPLHISAVQSPAGVIAFTGESGAGKSTLAGLIHKKSGWPMLCDDLAVATQSETRPILHGGMLRLKLWSDAIERLSATADMKTRDTTREDKYHLISPKMFVNGPLPMTALLMIGESNDISIRPINGAAAFSSIMNTIYRPELVNIFNDRATIMKYCAKIADQIDVYAFARPWGFSTIDEGADRIIEYFS